MNVEQGIVGIADTLITSGRECMTARKVAVYQHGGGVFFVMTSGLRSLRDKTITYFEDALEAREEPFGRLYHAVNLFSDQVRRVSHEDKRAITGGGLSFNIHTLIGGQMEHDKEPKLYMLYPEGNWVDTGKGTPYQIIGSTGYGKPVLDRALRYEDPMRHAFKVGCLSFDSTRISAADVDFPLDVVLYEKGSFRMVEHRYLKEDLAPLSELWQQKIRDAMTGIPADWVDKAFSKLDGGGGPTPVPQAATSP